MLNQEKTQRLTETGPGTPMGSGRSSGAGAAFVQEFWAGEERNYLCWCAGAG